MGTLTGEATSPFYFYTPFYCSHLNTFFFYSRVVLYKGRICSHWSKFFVSGVVLSMGFILKGKNLILFEQILFFNCIPILIGCVFQGSKQEVTKVVSCCKNARKMWCIRSPEVGSIEQCHRSEIPYTVELQWLEH